MCLSIVESTKYQPKKSGIGYVLMSYSPKRGYEAVFFGASRYLLGKWYKAKGKRNPSYDKYVPGFHIFTSIEDALQYSGGNISELEEDGERIVKVAYRGILATGYEENVIPCIVVKHRKLIGRVKP